MRLAISALPGFGIVTALTAALALWPHHAAPPAAAPTQPAFVAIDVVIDDPAPPCAGANGLIVRGHVTGGASHVQLAGPIIYTDVTTDSLGNFELRIPVLGDVCSVLRNPAQYAFSGDGMTVLYTISFEQ